MSTFLTFFSILGFLFTTLYLYAATFRERPVANPGSRDSHAGLSNPRRTPLKVLATVFLLAPAALLGLQWFVVEPMARRKVPEPVEVGTRTKELQQSQVATLKMMEAINTRYSDHKGAITDKGTLEELLGTVNKGLKENPEIGWAYDLRANIECDLGRYPEALADAKEAIKRDGFGIDLAWKFRNAGRFEDALLITDAVLAGKKPCEPLVLRGLLLYDLGRDEEATDLARMLTGCGRCRGKEEYMKTYKLKTNMDF